MAAATSLLTRMNATLPRTFWYRGVRMTIHLDSNDTNGAMALVESDCAPGCEPPLHIHENEDEVFYVLEGNVRLTRGSEQFVVGPGESGFLPRGVPHTFQILSERARVLGYITPGGFEEFFRAQGHAAPPEGPGSQTLALDMPRLIALCQQFGLRVIA